MNARGYNFSAGPAMLPEVILKQAQEELLNWQGTGMSVVEISHRSKEFMQVLEQAESGLRALLAIPNNYVVLFLSGAARTQFAMIPMNFLQEGEIAAYIVSGTWSSLAYQEARRCYSAYCLASSEQDNFKRLPRYDLSQLPDNTAYLYYTPNETIQGLRFNKVPKVKDLPLIADMTSCLLSEPICIEDYGVIFAGAQKNISTAGLTIVIARQDLLEKSSSKNLPSMLDYRTHQVHHSLYATPPAFSCYLAGKMFQWIQDNGGVAAIYARNCRKAAKLYDYIDGSDAYTNDVCMNERSLMNVCFTLKNPALDTIFLEQAKAQGLLGLKGHRLVGGMRASLYNPMPMAGVDALIAFMDSFAGSHK